MKSEGLRNRVLKQWTYPSGYNEYKGQADAILDKVYSGTEATKAGEAIVKKVSESYDRMNQSLRILTIILTVS